MKLAYFFYSKLAEGYCRQVKLISLLFLLAKVGVSALKSGKVAWVRG